MLKYTPDTLYSIVTLYFSFSLFIQPITTYLTAYRTVLLFHCHVVLLIYIIIDDFN